MRNSSLVKRICAENVTGLKHGTEATDLQLLKLLVVGEHSGGEKVERQARLERPEESMPALVTIKRVKNPFAVNLRFPGQG